jgi:hypothetical protein
MASEPTMYQRVCAGCKRCSARDGDVLYFAASPREAIRMAEEVGWLHVKRAPGRRSADYCPKCKHTVLAARESKGGGRE